MWNMQKEEASYLMDEFSDKSFLVKSYFFGWHINFSILAHFQQVLSDSSWPCLVARHWQLEHCLTVIRRQNRTRLSVGDPWTQLFFSHDSKSGRSRFLGVLQSDISGFFSRLLSSFWNTPESWNLLQGYYEHKGTLPLLGRTKSPKPLAFLLVPFELQCGIDQINEWIS